MRLTKEREKEIRALWESEPPPLRFGTHVKECLSEIDFLREDLKDWENDCNQDQQYIKQLQENQNTLYCALKEMYDSACSNATSTPSKESFVLAMKALGKCNG